MSNKIIFTAFAATISLLSLFTFIRKRKQNVKNLKYKKVGKVKKIIIYPIKSLNGIEIEEVNITKYGLEYKNFYDRGYLIINESNSFVSMKTVPSLILLKTSFDEKFENIIVESPKNGSIKIPLHVKYDESKIVNAKLYMKPTKGIDCGDEIANWFQQYLNKPGIRLIKHTPELEFRNSIQELNKKLSDNSDFKIIYQDSSAVHIINENSVDDLKSRMNGDYEWINYKNFRPDILVDAETLDEDSWRYVRIGSVYMKFLKPCERCKLPTVNPFTGETEVEPLETLRKYRNAETEEGKKMYGKAPLFGNNYAVIEEGTISINDDFYSA